VATSRRRNRLGQPAHADEASYLNDLHNSGIRDFNGGDPALLQVGYKLCQQMSYGAPPEQLVALALQRSDGKEGPMGSPDMANNLIAYTSADLCRQLISWCCRPSRTDRDHER